MALYCNISFSVTFAVIKLITEIKQLDDWLETFHVVYISYISISTGYIRYWTANK